jgi:DNA-binding transcriptional ArsR family regulator
MTSLDDDVEYAFRALASDRRLLILEWLKRPRAHFREQADGDLVKDGVCGVLIAEKLGVSQPTVSEHMKILSFYKRDEARIAKLKAAMLAKI